MFSRVKGKRVSLPPAPPSTPHYGTKYGGSESVKRWKKEEKSTPDAIFTVDDAQEFLASHANALRDL